MNLEKRASVPFSSLTGGYLYEIRESAGELWFITSKGIFWMGHTTSCCESVDIDEVFGDPEELRGAYITEADEPSSEGEGIKVRDFEEGYTPESYTWTFYRLQTPKGDLVIRWLGTSNGYYGEAVDFEQVDGFSDLEWLATAATTDSDTFPGQPWRPK